MTRQTPDSPDISEREWADRIDQAVMRLARSNSQPVELLSPDGSSAGSPPQVILAGSFNPLHIGHCRMAVVAAEITGEKVHFELSINNADKPPTSSEDIRCRLLPGLVRCPHGQPAPEPGPNPQPMFSPHGLLLSNHATFVRKAAEYGEVTFAVGIDTWLRIGDEAFYPPGRFEAAINMIAMMGCRFLVFGREIAGQFVNLDGSLATSNAPKALHHISTAVPESKFRIDKSSSKIRNESSPG